jgi:hypothetical protein
MKTAKVKYGLVAVSVITVVGGYLTLWLLLSRILDKLDGINMTSVSVVMFLFSAFLFPSIYTLLCAKGKPPKRWQVHVAQTYVLLAIFIALGFAYDALLSSDIPFGWRYFVLPLATLVIAFYSLRKIPKIREKLDESSQNW